MTMHKRILVYTGIPGSGKSTEAEGVVKESKGLAVRVNKDDIRASCFPRTKHSKVRETKVLEIRDSIVWTALENEDNNTIIIDDTNLHPKHMQTMCEIAEDAMVLYPNIRLDVERIWFDDSLNADLCHQRNEARERTVPYRVIEDMHLQYKKLKMQNADEEWPLRNYTGDDAVIFDIDGTLAHRNDRSPFDWKRVDEDEEDQDVSTILDFYYNSGFRVIVVSGRDSICRDETEEWLDRHSIHYDELFMRTKGSSEKDYVVKEAIYRNNILSKYNVHMVFDDRNQTTRMWRSLGLKCCQVAPGFF